MSDTESPKGGFLLLLIPGALFGAGLAISGMTNPAKVVGFLDVTGSWDPSLAFVMAGAVGVFALLNQLVHKRQAPLLGGSLPGRRGKGALSPKLFVGAGLFGVGWALGGVCPGPAVTDIALLKPEVFAYLGGMVAGMLIAQRGFGIDAPTPATSAPEPQQG